MEKRLTYFDARGRLLILDFTTLQKRGYYGGCCACNFIL